MVECLDIWSRGDTQEYSDLNKLARHFLKGNKSCVDGDVKDVPSKAYVKEVVEELRKGEEEECPICLEAFEDAVLTPCAHRLCRECLLASWRSTASGLCPVCRYSNISIIFLLFCFVLFLFSGFNLYYYRRTITRQDLITAPAESRFHIDIDKNWVESTKTAALLLELEKLRISGSKSIIFSQWTAFLDILEIPLSR